MFLIDSYAAAIVLCIITMFCWGSWPNTQKLTSRGWRFELFYWDYIIGILLFNTLFALTMGNYGHTGRSFFHDLSFIQVENVYHAMLSGTLFNLANILFVAAITYAGMAVAFPVGGGLALTIGVIVNYMAAPEKNAMAIFSGVSLILAAMICSGLSYRYKSNKDFKISPKGIVLAIVAGILFGFFYRFLAKSIAGNFENPETTRFTPYTALVFFALGALASNFLFNTLLMRYPLQGAPVNLKNYTQGKMKDHWLGIAGGMIWGMGLSFNILSSGQVGYAISFGLSQGNAMIAAIWGVFLWKEFSHSDGRTKIILSLMFSFYIAGIVVLALAR